MSFKEIFVQIIESGGRTRESKILMIDRLVKHFKSTKEVWLEDEKYSRLRESMKRKVREFLMDDEKEVVRNFVESLYFFEMGVCMRDTKEGRLCRGRGRGGECWFHKRERERRKRMDVEIKRIVGRIFPEDVAEVIVRFSMGDE